MGGDGGLAGSLVVPVVEEVGGVGGEFGVVGAVDGDAEFVGVVVEFPGGEVGEGAAVVEGAAGRGG